MLAEACWRMTESHQSRGSDSRSFQVLLWLPRFASPCSEVVDAPGARPGGSVSEFGIASFMTNRILTPGLRQVLQAVKAEPDDEDSYQDDAAVNEDVINVVADIEAIIFDEACLHCARRANCVCCSATKPFCYVSSAPLLSVAILAQACRWIPQTSKHGGLIAR